MQSPITGSTDTVLLETFQAQTLIADWKSCYQIDITEELHGIEEVELWRCNQTGLRFFAPTTVAGSGKLYEQLQKIDWYYVPDKWEQLTALKEIVGCTKVLEVGCGEGTFVKSAIENGMDARGIEMNPGAVEKAKADGLPVELADLHVAAEEYAGQFDAVCSFQVLEHVPDQGAFIQSSLRLLKPGGKLVACVPNADSFIKHRYDLLNLPPHHMSHWDCSTFKSLESCFDMRFEKCFCEPLDEMHIGNYLEGYHTHYHKRLPLVGKLLFNRHSQPIYHRLLKKGLRKYATGQTIYAQFVKVG